MDPEQFNVANLNQSILPGIYKMLYIILLIIFFSCNTKPIEHDFFPGPYPGGPVAIIGGNNMILSNESMAASWKIVDSSIFLDKVIDKYNQDTVALDHLVLFAVEMEDGQLITNNEFKLDSKPEIQDILPKDTLPTKALHYPGKMITALLISDNPNLMVRWSAELREGSNYIRQNIVLSSRKESVKIKKVIIFDGELQGARYAGSVLGSPIDYNNFFFALEHPIAQSKALLARRIGDMGEGTYDISGIIDREGEYIIAFEHGGGPADYNIQSVSMMEDDNTISHCIHPLNGKSGSSLYPLLLVDHTPEKRYSIKVDIEQPENATGSVHLYRKTDGILNFYLERQDELSPGELISEWSVIGVAPENQKRRAFLYYLERERARPYGQFLHYNCWWDITTDGASSFTSGQLLERMEAWNEKFIEPFDIHLQSFVFDDGWDDLDSVWYFDPVKFPDGFKPQVELCKKYKSGIGVWMSPFGGYGENKRRRLISAQREGLETNDKGMSLAGVNYYDRFLNRSLDMLMNYGVNYFKYDGFGGYEPAYLPDMEAGARLINTLRQYNPDVFINITVGSWPSPFWLKYVDCTWRGSGDLHMAGKGTRTQKSMTYRDGTLYNNIVRRAPYYPLNSIMTVGIAYADFGLAKMYINDSIADFKDMVRSSFGAGSSLQELYISHDRMKPAFWAVLAEAAKWARENEPVLKDVHWIGGSPINLEVYGFASWSPGKGIITLRNPDDESVDYIINLDRIFELPPDQSFVFSLRSPWLEDADQEELLADSKKDFILHLEPFETKVFEATQQ